MPFDRNVTNYIWLIDVVGLGEECRHDIDCISTSSNSHCNGLTKTCGCIHNYKMDGKSCVPVTVGGKSNGFFP